MNDIMAQMTGATKLLAFYHKVYGYSLYLVPAMQVAPKVLQGKAQLIVAHGSTLRALIKYLEAISDTVLTGVDLLDGQPTKWKVENSWGDKVGTKGFFVMTDDWMNEYCYQIVMLLIA